MVCLCLLMSTFGSSITVFAWNEVDVEEFITEVKQIYEEQDKIGKTDEEAAANRIIVKASRRPERYKNAECVKGTDEIYVYQYNDSTLAKEALGFYQSLSCVEWAEPDCVMQANNSITTYGNAMMQSDEAENYLLNHNITSEKITVAILDTGARFGAKMLEGRVSDSGINTSSSGTENSAYDDNDHGTKVAGIVVNNTPENVEIVAYKVLNENGLATSVSVALGIQAAIEDNVDVINLSLGGTEYSEILYEAITEAYENNIVIVCSSGNDNEDTANYFPASFEETITVGSIDEKGNRSFFSNWGEEVDFVAPGHNINVTNDQKDYGTSFSAPFVTSAVAMVKSVSDDMSAKQVKECLIQSCVHRDNLAYHDGFHIITDYDVSDTSGDQPTNTFFGIGTEKEELYYGYGMPQIASAIAVATDRNTVVEKPKFSLESGTYNEAIQVEIDFPEGYSVYYTTDESYPSAVNGTLYTSAISIENSSSIRAVAYNENGLRSLPIACEYRVLYYADETDFTINSSGYITEYNGDLAEIIVPDKINSVIVRGIAQWAFYSDEKIKGIVFPKTVTEICAEAFLDSSINYVIGHGIENLEEDSFNNTPLILLETPNLKVVKATALAGTSLRTIDFPNLIKAEHGAFGYNSYLTSVSLPKLESVSARLFDECHQLRTVKLDVALTIDSAAFRCCYWLKKVEAPSLERFIDTWNENMASITTFYACNNLTEINFPKVISLEGKCFSKCWALTTANLPNAKYIGNSTFEDCQRLETVNLESAETIGTKAFADTLSLKELMLPSVKMIENNCFENSVIVTLDTPELEQLGSYVFSCKNPMYGNYSQNTTLENFNAPKLKAANNYAFAYTSSLKKLELPCLEVLGKNVFKESGVCFLDVPNLTQSESLPEVEDASVVLSSKFSSCTFDATNRSLTIYGTPETYAENYAGEYNLKFVSAPIIVTQPPIEYNNDEEIILAEVVGFNKQYQWYGTYEKNNQSGEKITNATFAEFCPQNYKAYPYYYCVITSTDGDYVKELRTGITVDKISLADYSRLNELLERIPEDLSAYTAESRARLENAISLVKKDLTISHQREVDAMVEVIQEAIKGLKFIRIELSDTYLELKKNEQHTITVDAKGQIEWISTDRDVATVDHKGTVTAVGRGATRIVALVTDGNGNVRRAMCTVEVEFTWWQWLIYLFLFGWIWY